MGVRVGSQMGKGTLYGFVGTGREKVVSAMSAVWIVIGVLQRLAGRTGFLFELEFKAKEPKDRECSFEESFGFRKIEANLGQRAGFPPFLLPYHALMGPTPFRIDPPLNCSPLTESSS